MVKVNTSELSKKTPVIAKPTDQEDKNNDAAAHNINDSFVFIVLIIVYFCKAK
jgi:hypothetical protein